MKRAELEKLTAMAEDMTYVLPDITLRGDGEFVDASGATVSPEALLRLLFTARQQALELHRRLTMVPRRILRHPKESA